MVIQIFIQMLCWWFATQRTREQTARETVRKEAARALQISQPSSHDLSDLRWTMLFFDDQYDFGNSEFAALDLKEQGNRLLLDHKYALAAEKYAEAIDLYPTAILFSNRAQALIKIELYGLAIQDANNAIRLVILSKDLTRIEATKLISSFFIDAELIPHM